MTADQVKQAAERSGEGGSKVISSLVKLGHINEKVLATFLSKEFGVPAISLDEVKLTPEITRMVPCSLCEKHVLIPLSIDEKTICIALADPTNLAAIDDIAFLTNLNVDVYIATESAIRSLIDRFYTNRSGAIDTASFSQEHEKEEVTSFVEIARSEAAEVKIESDAAGDKPVIRMINKILVEAARRKASDIHIEPYDSFSRVRFRIDGTLHEVMKLPANLKIATPARIKVMAKMDISEKRLPQDGRIPLRTKTKRFDVRVSSLPTMFGEKIVMRLLDQGDSAPDLHKLGFEPEQFTLFRKAALQPYGMLLVTGPTGSGKSTTLYAALAEVNGPGVNISTVEDPVEYNMVGINQVQMKDSIGLNFASALRSLLRQDPDILMIGEIRDHETAEIAIKAALTGHLVFSTLHTNDAPSTITRLLHMGVEPFLITASLNLVQAQRLVRVNCKRCAQPDTSVTKEMLREAEVPASEIDKCVPLKGIGCEDCGNTGYSGRQGIFEVMYLTESMRAMIVKGTNSDDLKREAIRQGMSTLRQSAVKKLIRGETTFEEVLNNSRPDGEMVTK